MNPKSIAVVGASRTPGRAGYVVVENVSRSYRGGRVFPVNPSAREILGLPCYPDLKSLPESPEIVVLSVPPDQILSAVDSAGTSGARGLVVIASGFAEEGGEGRALESEMVRRARAHGMRILGPNTTGLLNLGKDLLLTFIPFDEVPRGSVSFVVQSGTFGGGLLEQIRSSYSFGISKSIGLGNKADLGDEEALRYLGDDGDTRVIAVHMEGTKNGRTFFESARDAARKKPLVLLKSGRTPFGAEAMLSHTASLAGNDALFTAACRQAGIIRVRDIEEFFDTIKAFAGQPLPRGNRVAVVTFSGAAGVMGADVLYEEGMTLAALDPETIKTVRDAGPPWHRIGNPMDIWPTEMMIGYENAYTIGMRAALKDPQVDAVLVVHSAMPGNRMPVDTFSFFHRIHQEFPDKPMFSVLHGNRAAGEEIRVFLEKRGIPSYPSIDRAARVLAHMHRYAARAAERYRLTFPPFGKGGQGGFLPKAAHKIPAGKKGS
ncbi:MAG TPA: CoA-binding protein [Thermodesulfobacteriota bacterium]|nr:CoA-binding protein [Thermodesulfobacteriota bacterium]